MGSCAGFGTHVLCSFGCTLCPSASQFPHLKTGERGGAALQLCQFKIPSTPLGLYFPEAPVWKLHISVPRLPGRARNDVVIWLERVSSWFRLEGE